MKGLGDEPGNRPAHGPHDPRDPAFVVDPWLHPSMYTAVPDPDWPPGYEQAVRLNVETQWTGIREAEAAAYRGHDNSTAARTALQPADSGWPARVRAAWESYRQARTTADRLAEAGSRPAARQGPDAADEAWWKARYADHDAEVAYEAFTAEWDDWQTGHELSAGPDEPEAGA